MSNLIKELSDRKLIQPPSWLPTNIVYLTITGSVSYGCEDTKANSDFDVYGVCIPPKDQVFPHFAGLIPLFDDFNFFGFHFTKLEVVKILKIQNRVFKNPKKSKNHLKL